MATTAVKLVAIMVASMILCTTGISVRMGRGTNENQNKDQSDKKSTDLPPSMRVDVPMGDRMVNLNLERSDVLDATLPVFLGLDKHSFVQMDNREKDDFAVYQDVSKQASFVMWSKERTGNGSPSMGMRGTFDDSGETFSMEPLSSRSERLANDPMASDEPPVTFTFNEMDFSMSKVNRSNVFVSEQEQAVSNMSESVKTQVGEFMKQMEEQGHQHPFYSYEVELFLVVDYAIFDKWMKASSARDYLSRELEAIDNIRFYFAHILNGMALRYKSVTESTFQIRIIPVGLFVAKTPAASFWTEDQTVKEAYHYTEAYKALDLFEQWINDEKANLPAFDQASLFSGNRLFSGYYNGRRRTINGLATITGICGYQRASLNYDQGQYGSIQNGAHELGHNLGAYHDGYNNDCKSADQYVMATSPGALTDRNFDNTFEFSYCSKKAFYDYLLYLNGKKANCLTERRNYDTFWNYDYYLQSYPGQRYTADEQCKLIYGTQSSYCGGGHLDQGICSQMLCWRPELQTCYVHVEQRAADATQCGDRKWCMKGRCVSDSRAPSSVNPTCIYGDFLGVVERTNNYKCSDLERTSPHLCYDEEFKSKCCKTCDRIRKDDGQCEFGDRTPDYCRDRVESRDCYDADTREKCCQTCANFKQDKPTCQYGDRATSTCRDAEASPRHCYNQNDTCCETCPRLATGPKGCEWGDKAGWCRDAENKRHRCYDKGYTTNCCKTCKPDGPKGCEFGDRSQHCRSDECGNPERRKLCCKTCSQHSTEPPTGECTNKYTWCSSYVPGTPISCQSDQNVIEGCCEACRRIKMPTVTTLKPEECSDEFTWCASYVSSVPISCQSDSFVREGCCKACNGFPSTTTTTKPSNGCTSPDKYTWCARHVSQYPSSCQSDKYVREGCCEACSRA